MGLEMFPNLVLRSFWKCSKCGRNMIVRIQKARTGNWDVQNSIWDWHSGEKIRRVRAVTEARLTSSTPTHKSSFLSHKMPVKRRTQTVDWKAQCQCQHCDPDQKHTTPSLPCLLCHCSKGKKSKQKKKKKKLKKNYLIPKISMELPIGTIETLVNCNSQRKKKQVL
jgi:hypothetical protein